MDTEPTSNIGRIHKECANDRWLICQIEINNKPLEEFVNKFVKIAFKSNSGAVEHMWVEVFHTTSDLLIGVLDNDPRECTHLECGDLIPLTKDEIEEILF